VTEYCARIDNLAESQRGYAGCALPYQTAFIESNSLVSAEVCDETRVGLGSNDGSELSRRVECGFWPADEGRSRDGESFIAPSRSSGTSSIAEGSLLLTESLSFFSARSLHPNSLRLSARGRLPPGVEIWRFIVDGDRIRSSLYPSCPVVLPLLDLRNRATGCCWRIFSDLRNPRDCRACIM
jgi:hypothetical protein